MITSMQPEQALEVIIDRGSWTIPVSELTVPHTQLRAQLRALAKARGIRLLSSRAGDLFTVWWPEYEPTPIQQRARRRALESALVGDEPPVTYDHALTQERRAQIHPL